MKYYNGYVNPSFFENGTAKAIKTNYWIDAVHEEIKWIPRSIIKVCEINEAGNVRVMIPCWFFWKNRLAYDAFAAIRFGDGVGCGGDPMIEI